MAEKTRHPKSGKQLKKKLKSCFFYYSYRFYIAVLILIPCAIAVNCAYADSDFYYDLSYYQVDFYKLTLPEPGNYIHSTFTLTYSPLFIKPINVGLPYNWPFIFNMSNFFNEYVEPLGRYNPNVLLNKYVEPLGKYNPNLVLNKYVEPLGRYNLENILRDRKKPNKEQKKGR